MSDLSDRSIRLAERFSTIKTTLTELCGDNLAFAISSVAYLEAIEYSVLQALRRVEMEADPEARKGLRSLMHQEIKVTLQSYHREICEHLGVDQVVAIERSNAFKEIIDDICNQRG